MSCRYVYTGREPDGNADKRHVSDLTLATFEFMLIMNQLHEGSSPRQLENISEMAAY